MMQDKSKANTTKHVSSRNGQKNQLNAKANEKPNETKHKNENKQDNQMDDSFDVAHCPYIEEPWTILESYFKDQHLERLVRHQIESYNYFVEFQIFNTIDMFNSVHIKSDNDYDPVSGLYALEIVLTFENFNIYRPQIHENNGAIKLMFPQEARLRNFTYSAAMTIDIHIQYIVRTGASLEHVKVLQKVLPKIHIGKLPIMLKSSICVLNQYPYVDHQHTGECKYDAGGYFIINGSEKVVLGQEAPGVNRIYCHNVSKNDTKYSWRAEIKSVPDHKYISPKQINLMISSKHNGFGYSLWIQIPRVKQPLPLFVIFRALGIVTDKAICEYILLNIEVDHHAILLHNLQASIIEANKYMTQEEALKHLTSHVSYTPINTVDKETGLLKKRQFALDVLRSDLFPHCHTEIQKIYFLGYMAKKLMMAAFGFIKADDRDSYLNKRVDLTGTSLNNLFRNLFNKVVKDAERQTIKEINTGSWRSSEDWMNIINLTNIYKIIKGNVIENGIKRGLSTGDFGIKLLNSSKVGVAQVLNRLTYVGSLSHLRRLSTPTDKSGKLIQPRKLHPTSWGFICAVETPEGHSVGVVKNMSYMAHITIHSDSSALYDYVRPYIVELDAAATPATMYDKVKVMVNGCWIGFAIDAVTMYPQLKRLKAKGIINIYTSIVFDTKMQEIRICNDSGRLTRPVLRVLEQEREQEQEREREQQELNNNNNNNNKVRRNILLTKMVQRQLERHELSWDDLLTDCKIDQALIEYIDPEEQAYSLIAVKPMELLNTLNHYTHCEIHPSTIFGVVASCIPYPDHNQSPRNTYQCAQAKQAMGIYTTNFNERMDKTAYVLTYPTRPLVDTRVMNMIKLNENPSGCNITVAIMTHTGYNQEDSLLINKGSIDRGLLQITITHTEKDEDKQKINGDEEIRCKPVVGRTKGMRFGNYNKVGANGLVPENTLIENRDIIIAKITPIKENRNDPTKVIKYEDGSKQYKTTEETYIDKNYVNRNADGYRFAKVRLRSLRKPVIGDKFSSRHGQKGTVGNIIPEEDMPFTANGSKPDIIINPHAIPSRMTIGQLQETLLGKVLVELGLFGDGTSFGELSVAEISRKLLELGYSSNGDEVMYNGLTGEQIECNVFIGPVFYQRLKHMVNDKQHSRSTGPMVILTRQPQEGRSRDGGLKFGEMEKDAMVSHGASLFTRGRMYDASDKYAIHVCKRCGLMASYNAQLNIHLCHTCDNRTDFAYVEIPYACKLLFQELTTMNVVPRLITEHCV